MIGREKEKKFIKDGLSLNGSLRCSLIFGAEGIGKTLFLESILSEFIYEGDHIFLPANASECQTPEDLLSQIGRNLLASERLNLNESLMKFARKLGGMLIKNKESVNDSDPETNLAKSFVNELTNQFTQAGLRHEIITPVLVIEDLELLPESVLSWISDKFNHALRQSSWFNKCRFVFTSTKPVKYFEKFWAEFGIENPVELSLPLFGPSEISDFAAIHGYPEININRILNESKGIPLQVLKCLENSTIMKDDIVMEDSPKNTHLDLSSYSDKEIEYLCYLAYPSLINRHNLEHFCSPKLAAFAYNWLKRKKSISEIKPNGDLVLNSSIRELLRGLHQEQEPEVAEKFSTLATVLDSFYTSFPDIENQWVPINLQAFNSFSKSLCRKVFSEVEIDPVLHFIDSNDELFEKQGKHFKLNNDSCLLIRRYMELSGLQEKENLSELVQAVWEEDQIAMQKRKLKIDEEEVDIKSEIEDIQSQVSHFQNLKNNLESSFQKKQTNKPERVVTFSISMAMVVFGILITGVSLLSDLFGSYHAACGLALTIFGFFWPNVEVKTPRGATSGDVPNLAIETQHRSLDHRINGLLTRANSLAANLEALSGESSQLEQYSLEPYLVAD